MVLDENLIETVNTKVYDSGNLKKDQNYNSGNVTLFTLKNADEYSKITIRYRYICYVDYGGASVRVGNKSYGNKGYISWYEDTQELTAKTGTASASANNGSSNTSWTARAGFQLLDIYVEP